MTFEDITLKEILENLNSLNLDSSNKKCKYEHYSNPFVTEVVEFDCTYPFDDEDYIGANGCQGEDCKYFEEVE